MPRWRFSWSAGEDFAADTFNVYVRDVSVGLWRLVGSTAGFEFTVDLPNVSVPYEAAVAGVVNGIEEMGEDWTIIPFTPTSLADIPIPPDVASFAVAQVDGTFDVRFRWGAVSDPHLDGYEIREGADWATGLPRVTVQAGVTETTCGALAATSVTYWIKAFSKQGQWSETALSATITVVAMSGYVAEAATSESGGGFGGTKSGTQVVSGGLQIKPAPAVADDWTDIADTYTWPPGLPHVGTGTYVTDPIEATDGSTGIVVDEVPQIVQGGAKQTPRTMVADDWRMIVRPEVLNGVAYSPSEPRALNKIFGDETVIAGRGMNIEIDTTPDDPSGTPTWDGWREWIPGCRYRYRAVRFRITLTSVWWDVWRIGTFIIRRYRKNLKDEGDVLVTGTGGTAVTFVQPFTKIPVVQASIDETTLSTHVRVSDVTRTGCLVRIFNTGGTEQSSGTVRWQAQGV